MTENELRNFVMSEARAMARELHECGCGCDFCGDESPVGTGPPTFVGGGYDYEDARIDGEVVGTEGSFVDLPIEDAFGDFTEDPYSYEPSANLSVGEPAVPSAPAPVGGCGGCGGCGGLDLDPVDMVFDLGVGPDYASEPLPALPPATPEFDMGMGMPTSPYTPEFDMSVPDFDMEMEMGVETDSALPGFDSGFDFDLGIAEADADGAVVFDGEDGELLNDNDSPMPELPAPAGGERAALHVRGYTDRGSAYNTLIGLGVGAVVADDAIDFAESGGENAFIGVYDIATATEMADAMQNAGIDAVIEAEGDYWADQEMDTVAETAEEFDNPLDYDTGYEYVAPQPNTLGLGHEMAATAACAALEAEGLVCSPNTSVGLIQVSSDVPVLTVRRIIDAALPDWQSESGESVYVVQTPRGILVQF